MGDRVPEQEAVEFGVYRENLYIRQRKALREMEDEESGELRSNSNPGSRYDSVRL